MKSSFEMILIMALKACYHIVSDHGYFCIFNPILVGVFFIYAKWLGGKFTLMSKTFKKDATKLKFTP